jgi:hypothetical protein
MKSVNFKWTFPIKIDYGNLHNQNFIWIRHLLISIKSMTLTVNIRRLVPGPAARDSGKKIMIVSARYMNPPLDQLHKRMRACSIRRSSMSRLHSNLVGFDKSIRLTQRASR